MGEVNSSSIGYGIHQAWIYATMFGTSSLFGVTSAPNGTDFSSIYLISITVNFLALLVCGILDEKITRLSVNHYPVIIPMALMAVGSLMVLFCGAESAYSIPFSIASGVATGIGSAIYLLYWGIAFSRLGLISVVMNTVISFAFATLLYGIIAVLPAPYAGFVTCALPIAEGIVVRSHAPRPYQSRHSIPFFNPLPVSKWKFHLAFALPMLFFGVALGYIRATGMSDVFLSLGQSADALMLATADLIAIIVLVGGLVFMRSERVEDFMRPMVTLIALAMAFVPICAQTADPIHNVIVIAGYICFEGVLWIMFAAFSQRYRLSPVLVFGIGRGSLGLGSVVGLALTSFLEHSGTALPFSDSTFVIVALVCIIAGQALLPRERDVRRIVLHGSIDVDSLADMLNLKKSSTEPNAVQAGETEDDSKPADEAQKSEDAKLDRDRDESATAIVEAPETPTGQEAARDTDEGHPPDHQGEKPAGSTKLADAVSVSNPPSAEEPSSGRRKPSRTGGLLEQASAHNDANDDEPRIGFFRRKCEVVSNQYLLSARETEVLFYLAKGYNSAYLQEKLYISEGTAKTHIRHIYGKTNVHSQQELMRLVNEIRV